MTINMILKRSDAISPQAADVVNPALTDSKQLSDEKTRNTFTPQQFDGTNRNREEEIEFGQNSNDCHSNADTRKFADEHEQALKEKYSSENINNVNNNSSDLESDFDRDELIPDSPRVQFPEKSGAEFSQRLPGNFNPYESPFTAEEARLRYSLESAQLKERFRQSLNDEVLRRGFSLPDQRHDANKHSPGRYSASQPNSPESKSLASPPLNAFQGQGQPPRSHNFSYDEQDSALVPQIREGLYFCHLCSFSGTTQQDFDLHMTVHFEHVCPHCDYKSRTEGRLKRHIKDFHTEDPDGGFGTRTMPGRPKVFRCKQCEFSSTDKIEFWSHSRTHIKEDKLLQCPRCPFVTEYKHHLEYHLRNHFGSKPFKCPKCNYACVNKSMLNSHMKSHTNVYQYRCADCTYATKYCHSLKLHLRKYNHKPAAVLNSDGSLPQGMDATASGLSLLTKRGPPRGPRGPRKDKLEQGTGNFLQMPQSHMSPLGPMPALPGMMSPFWPMIHGQLPNGLNGMSSPLGFNPRFGSPLGSLPVMGMKSEEKRSPPISSGVQSAASNPFKCNICNFVGTSREVLTSHVMKVHSSENQDLFSIFGISSESLLEDNHKRMNILNALRSPLKSPRTGMFGPNPELPLGIKKEVHDFMPPKPSQERNGQGNKEQLSPFSYMNGKFQADANSKDEGIDILKQMTLKFGSGPTNLKRKFDSAPGSHSSTVDSPLDLTKPRNSPPLMYPTQPFSALDDSKNDDGNHSSGENSVYSNVMSPTPRKRSRKGKAFKLDTLCMKLQEKQGGIYGSDEDSVGEIDDMYSSDLLPVEADVDVNSPDTENNDEGEEIEVEKYIPDTEKASDADKKQEELEEYKKQDEGPEENDDHDKELAAEELRQIHSSLEILNEKKIESKQVVEINETELNREDRENGNIEKLEQSSTPSSPLSENISKPALTPVPIQSHNRRKAVPAAVQRGADIAWKMLNDPKYANPSQIIGNGSNGHKMELSAMDKKLWIEAPDCTSDPSKKSDYQCPHCQIAFGDCIMYTMHMGYHGYKDPYKCNMCGDTCKDRVEFFLHIARAAHN